MRIMNPKSLENLKAHKPRKDGHGYRYTIAQQTIDELFSKMVEGLSLKAASKAVGIHFTTAQKYFEQGDTRRGIQPLRRRLLIFQERSNERFDTLLLERRQHLIEVIVNAIAKIEEQIAAGVIMKKPNLSELERLIRLEMYLRGGGQGSPGTEKKTMLFAEDIRALASGEENQPPREQPSAQSEEQATNGSKIRGNSTIPAEGSGSISNPGAGE